MTIQPLTYLRTLTDTELDEELKTIMMFKKVRTILPGFTGMCTVPINHDEDDIRSLTNFDDSSRVQDIDISGVKLTPMFLSHCKYYFSNQFPYLEILDLSNINNISALLNIIFSKNNINNFPSLRKIRLDGSSYSTENLELIYHHFIGYEFIIRDWDYKVGEHIIIILCDGIGEYAKYYQSITYINKNTFKSFDSKFTMKLDI